LFETSPKLVDIILSHNGISRLNDGTFGVLTHLDLLDLSHNSLMKLEDNVFVGMNITHLDLGFNSLRRVPGVSLRKLTAAKTVVLDGNLFFTLDEGSLNRISVEFLSISHSPHLARHRQFHQHFTSSLFQSKVFCAAFF
jgi:Leucine-rich repeat (LRR) protein